MKLPRTSTRRQGAALIAAIVAMAVLTVLLSVMTLQAVAQREQLQQRERQLQADWLTRAGLEWAAARLLENPAGFSEEAPDWLPDAKVHIVVEKSVQDTYAVTVEARVGLAERAAVVRTRSGSFRRSDKDKVVRLQALPSP